MIQKGIIKIIEGYQKFVSPLHFPCCRFMPSCSDYAKLAIEEYGVFHGGFKGLIRLLRCHPFSKGGWNPVPLKGKAK